MSYLKWVCFLLFLPLISGCADRTQYYQAVREQNTAIQIQRSAFERELKEIRQRHQERMVQMIGQAMKAAALTPDHTDDIMVPVLFLVLQDKWDMVEMMPKQNPGPGQMQKIEAPSDGADYLKAASPYFGMLLTGLVGWKAFDTVADVAAQAGGQYFLNGQNATMNQNSFNTGSYNNQTAGTEAAINASNTPASEQAAGELCGAYPITNVDQFGVKWVSETCSCSSYLLGHCTP